MIGPLSAAMRPRLFAAAIVLAGFATMLIVNWPGHLEFDSIRQLMEGEREIYSNWHPPIMSWMLGVAYAIGPVVAPFVIFDAVLAFGSILSLLWLVPRTSWFAVVAAAVCVVLPQLFLFQAIVWKDMLFADACLAAFVCLAHAAVHWKQERWRFALLGGAVVFTSLAILSRQNGMVVLPCAAVALGTIAARDATWRTGFVLGAGFLTAVVVLTVGVHSVLQLRATKALGPIEQAENLQLYDIAGMLKQQPGLVLSVLDRERPVLAQRLRAKAPTNYTPVGHDLLTDDPVIHGMIHASVSPVSLQWRSLVLAHPGLYLSVRARDFSWIFFSLHPEKCLVYEVGVTGLPSDLRAAGVLPRYDDRDDWLDQSYGTPLLRTPVLSHPVYALAAIISLVVLLRRRRPADLAMAGLLAAAMLYALSYFVIAISCQYRYLFALDLASIAAVFYLLADVRWPVGFARVRRQSNQL